MSHNVLAELEPDVSTAKRAQWEAYEFSLDAPGLVRVRNASYGDADADDHTYRVNVEDGVPVACECPADAYQEGACKHRVAVAIRAPVLAAAAEHDRDVRTDGGVVVEREESDDCECLDDDEFPCWPCVRDGRRELPE